MKDASEAVEAVLCDELERLTGIDGARAAYRGIHQWRYAGIADPLGEDFLLDMASRLAACGDWCIKGRVEAAYKSADALAARLGVNLPQ